MSVITKTAQLPDGRTISIEAGKVAKQTDGSAVIRLGNTVLLTTVCAAKGAVPEADFIPLQVDYREQHSAAGRFPGGFTKHEDKPSGNEILTSRLMDRALRPFFPSNYHAEVYVQIMLLSADSVNQPDALAGLAALAAMVCSDIPFDFCIGEVRVAHINGEYATSPTFEQTKQADMDLMVGATKDNITIVEGEMKGVSKLDLINALRAAHGAIKPMYAVQDELNKELGKDVEREYDHGVNGGDLREKMSNELYQSVYDITKQTLPKQERHDAFDKVFTDFLKKYGAAHAADLTEEELEEKHAKATCYYDDVLKNVTRRYVLDGSECLNDRRTDEIHPIWCEVSPLPMPHGGTIFTRGETQSLSACALGTKLDKKMIDDVLDKSYQRFLLHHNFPLLSTGEAKTQRGVGHREIGRGHLAWRSLKGRLLDGSPCTVRLMSQILESNGSSSMATACADTLTLMDTGVPMREPVSGITMDLVRNPDEDEYAVLSDILGDEDRLDDVNFETTDTHGELTATQMGIKRDSLSFKILEKALLQAEAGREHILNKMLKATTESHPGMKPQVPRIEAFEILKEFIGAVIGPDGKIIQQVQEDTGATITIDKIDNVDRIQVSAPNKESIGMAITKVKSIVTIPEVGKIYEGTVRFIMPYGCFVEVLPGRDGLLCISEIDWKRLETVEDANIHEGDEIRVRLLKIDPKTGKYKPSRRVLLEKPEGYVGRKHRPRREDGGKRRPRRDDNREGRRHYGNDDRQPRHFEHRNEGSDRAYNNKSNEFNGTFDAE